MMVRLGLLTLGLALGVEALPYGRYMFLLPSLAGVGIRWESVCIVSWFLFSYIRSRWGRTG